VFKGVKVTFGAMKVTFGAMNGDVWCDRALSVTFGAMASKLVFMRIMVVLQDI